MTAPAEIILRLEMMIAHMAVGDTKTIRLTAAYLTART